MRIPWKLFVIRSLIIWLVREEDSYVNIYRNFISHLPYVISTVLFTWSENLIFFSKRYIYMRNSEHIRLVRVFWYIESLSITGISPIAHSFPELTAALIRRFCTFSYIHLSFFTAHSSQQFFPKPQPNQTHPKCIAQRIMQKLSSRFF
jgi:hypothetical protein